MSAIDDPYVIEDTRARGDCARWWGPDRRGYTTDLNRAGRYSREEAEAQARSRSTDRAWRLATLLDVTNTHVNHEALAQVGEEVMNHTEPMPCFTADELREIECALRRREEALQSTVTGHYGLSTHAMVANASLQDVRSALAKLLR